MLGCGGWEVGMGMSSMVGIGQGWDVLREPGLGKVYAPIWKYPEYIELQQQEIAVQIINLFRKAQKRCEQRELGGLVGYQRRLCSFNSSTPLVDCQLNLFVFCICICICMLTYKHKSKLTTKTLQHRPPPPSSNHPPNADHCSGRFAFNENGKNSAN